MIVVLPWKSRPVLQVTQPVFNGGVGCGGLVRATEREGESEREKKNKSVHYQTRNTRQWVKVINVDVQGRTKGGKDTTRFRK